MVKGFGSCGWLTIIGAPLPLGIGKCFGMSSLARGHVDVAETKELGERSRDRRMRDGRAWHSAAVGESEAAKGCFSGVLREDLRGR